jgi:cyclophilin family peptidyl-prolyl cis-trans isomerase
MVGYLRVRAAFSYRKGGFMVWQNNALRVCLLFLALTLPFTEPMVAQDLHTRLEERRRENLESILRVQDLRTPHDGKLISLLTDEDPVVAERATLAYGSIQDTTVLPLLQRNLTQGPGSVQLAAAFAIGQTGTQLSLSGRQQLEHELLWVRLSETGAAERLIEEIGMFGTVDALNELMIRVGNVHPLWFTQGLTMSIARFAIRGIITEDAVRYLLQFLRPVETTPWEVVYALQRIGDTPPIRQDLDQIVLLSKHTDPLIRMNLATLLGKLRDERTSLEPLAVLAEFDADWRVRVNALKALASFNLRGRDSYITIFKRGFFDANDQIVMTALTSIATTGIDDRDTSEAGRETMYQLRYIAENRSNNFPWQHQAAAALSYATLAGPRAISSVKPTQWPEPRLQAGLLEAVCATGAPEAAEIILGAAGDERPVVACAALEGLRNLCKQRPSDTSLVARSVAQCRTSLSSGDVAIVTTAASILGDSLFRRESSVMILLDALSSLRLPDDIEAMQEIIATLGKLKDRRAFSPLLDQLRQKDRSVAVAAAAALTEITGEDYSTRLQQWFQPLLTDFDFDYLRSLPQTIPVVLETARGDIHIELSRDAAPFTIMSMLKLSARQGFYRGQTFHRVVPNFVVQGGDPRGDGWGGPGYSLRSEFAPSGYGTGTVGIASAGKDTEGSQFFITHSPQPHLDGRYTIIGRVVSGMEIVDRLQVGDRLYDFRPLTTKVSK